KLPYKLKIVKNLNVFHDIIAIFHKFHLIRSISPLVIFLHNQKKYLFPKNTGQWYVRFSGRQQMLIKQVDQ
ncbi:hypothetical protein NGI46_28585, partial [Peribacillus butanolivorans]|uniref:hypothetical protein n=1 Tax=Peribacillus butanolivorans TaxID=421767 RepID=UPI00207D48A9